MTVAKPPKSTIIFERDDEERRQGRADDAAGYQLQDLPPVTCPHTIEGPDS